VAPTEPTVGSRRRRRRSAAGLGIALAVGALIVAGIAAVLRWPSSAGPSVGAARAPVDTRAETSVSGSRPAATAEPAAPELPPAPALASPAGAAPTVLARTAGTAAETGAQETSRSLEPELGPAAATDDENPTPARAEAEAQAGQKPKPAAAAEAEAQAEPDTAPANLRSPRQTPGVEVHGDETRVFVPVRGTAEGMTVYDLSSPGVVVNLPHGTARLPLENFGVHRGLVSRVWLRKGRSGVQVRVIFRRRARYETDFGDGGLTVSVTP
jgi:hypothetical protein